MKEKRFFGIVATATVALTAALFLASCRQIEERDTLTDCRSRISKSYPEVARL